MNGAGSRLTLKTSMMKTVFNFYTDPGHGWLKVPFSLLVELGIENDISAYSYMRGEFAYLEEDCDASLFDKVMRERGIEPRYHVQTAEKQSKIRGYAYYRYLKSAA